LASPVGICIGIGIASTGSPLMISIFSALAAGTFLYVGANEVVAEEFDGGQRRVKFLILICGMGLIIGLSFLYS